MRLKGLYAITDEKLTPKETMLRQVEAALAGGARIVQLRDKNSDDQELLGLATALRELCHSYNALFLVNDRVNLAREVGADGVHIGKTDTSYPEARRRLGPSAIIGVSCYNELERAVDAAKKGADYVAFGSFFPSPTKPEAVRASIDLIEKAKAKLKVPICCIGGITSENVRELVAKGADMAAVISDLWKSQDVTAKARKYASVFDYD